MGIGMGLGMGTGEKGKWRGGLGRGWKRSEEKSRGGGGGEEEEEGGSASDKRHFLMFQRLAKFRKFCSSIGLLGVQTSDSLRWVGGWGEGDLR